LLENTLHNIIPLLPSEVIKKIKQVPRSKYPISINDIHPFLSFDLDKLFEISNVTVKEKMLNDSVRIKTKEEIERNCHNFKWKIGTKIFIPTLNKMHGRLRAVGVVYDFSHEGLKRGGLAEEIIDSFETPAVHRRAQVFKRLLSILIQNIDDSRKIKNIFSRPTHRLRPIDIEWLFVRLEDVLENREGLSEKTKYSYSSEFRSWVFGVSGLLENGSQIYRSIKSTTRFRNTRCSREIISEVEDPGASTPELALPISMLRHDSLRELEGSAFKHLEGRNQRIREACWDSINNFIRWRDLLDELKEAPLSEEGKKYIHLLSVPIFDGNQRYKDYIGWQKHAELSQVLQAHIHWIEQKEIYKFSRFEELKGPVFKTHIFFKRLKADFPEFSTRYTSVGISNLPGLLCHYYLPNWILVCLRLLFQIEFAWNHDTAIHITRSGISWQDKDCQLTSIKPKTEKAQIAWASKNMPELINMIKLLERQDDNVRQYWEREDDRIFSGWTSGRDYPKFVIFADHHLLGRFKTAHSLPQFTSDQLRDQAGNTFYLKTKDPHATQALLGHDSLATTQVYLDQTINRILNEANMNEFMLRLGASIVWAVGGEEALSKYGFDNNDLDKKLLFPVTDNPTLEKNEVPICDEWFTNKSTAIIINPSRMAHAMRQREYYRSNWERIYSINSERFNSTHLQRIIFNRALCQIIEDSKYGHIFKQMSREIMK